VASESDVVKVKVRPLKPSDYELGPSFTKEFSLVGKDKKSEKLRVMKKPSLFNKNFKVSKCGKSGCKDEPLKAEEEEQATRCSFSGKLDSDPDSTVYISGCPEKESMDISLMSKKSKLSFNTYRLEKAGKIKVDNRSTFSDVREIKENQDYEDYGWTTLGSDYTGDKGNGTASVLANGYTYSYLNTESEKGERCCRPIKSKCIVNDNFGNTCKITKGRNRCGKDCTRIIKSLEELERKEKKKKEKERKQHPSVLHDYNRIGPMKYERAPEGDGSPKQESSAPRRYDQDQELEQEGKNQYSYEGYSGEDGMEGGGADGKGLKVGEGQKLNQKQLEMLVTAAEEQENSTNPLCKHDEFRRSRELRVIKTCGRADVRCKQKQPVPKEKIYDEKTIEVGVFIDRHLYKNMEEVLKTQDEERVKMQFLRMVNRLFSQVETFLMNPTFTSKGGFKIMINGMTFYKKYGHLESDWDSAQMATEMLRKFQLFANKVNSLCDGDRNSYDAMVLLTGRYNYHDMRPGGAIGYALTGTVCSVAPALTLTLRLDEEGSHTIVMPRLLAHEFGHLLGADHDGDKPMNMHSIYKDSARVPCPAGKALMSPTVGMEMQTWSECTRKMIDAEFDRREKDNYNCFFT